MSHLDYECGGLPVLAQAACLALKLAGRYLPAIWKLHNPRILVQQQRSLELFVLDIYPGHNLPRGRWSGHAPVHMQTGMSSTSSPQHLFSSTLR